VLKKSVCRSECLSCFTNEKHQVTFDMSKEVG
jgi:hypothetical protein